MNKVFKICEKDGVKYYLNGNRYVTKIIKIRPYVVGSEYGQCFHQRKYFFYSGDKLLPITDVVDKGHNECTFKLDGVDTTVKTQATPYGYSYKMSNAFDQGNSYNIFSNLANEVGKPKIDIIITFAKPLKITRLGWENYTSTGRSIKDVEIYYGNKAVFRTIEADRQKYILKHDISLLLSNIAGGVIL